MKNIKLKPVKDQVIVITGASSGIGLETARLAAKAGARVVIGARHEDEIQNIVKDIRSRGGEAVGIGMDVRKHEDHIKLKDTAIKAYGRIDTWVNNAGKSIFGKLTNTSLEDEKDLFETNFWGIRHGSLVALPELKKSKGALINLGSEVSGVAIPLQGMYSATKHAVKAFTDALRVELTKEKAPVSVTLVRPAAINTPYADHAKNSLEEGGPSLPAPIYDVSIVAKAILKAAEKPQRDAYIGFASRAFTVMETIAPKLSDKFLLKMFEQQKEGKQKHSMGETRSEQDHHVSKSSAYTKVTAGQKKVKDKGGEKRV
ncbi:MAG: hypothetical protein CME64_08790 [Halobacteriovoraceae bacterium]|nr:hypothetical protein [Halobacteriovoraceae bacterium]|tara:strand:- start:297124 stop:298068 length:945 start_codon:yes stop_codon:yes gene_type:complete